MTSSKREETKKQLVLDILDVFKAKKKLISNSDMAKIVVSMWGTPNVD